MTAAGRRGNEYARSITTSREPKRLVALLAAALTATTLAACGGGSSAASTPQATIVTYVKAVANGDGAAACAMLTPTLEQRIVKAASADGQKFSSCSALFSAVATHLTSAQRQKFLNAKVTHVTQTGNSATATVSGATDQPILTKIGGKWLISGGLGF